MLDTPVMFIAVLALLPIARTGGMVSRMEGAMLVAFYVAYIFVLAARGG
jgi:Ca2+/Na+ antiporter